MKLTLISLLCIWNHQVFFPLHVAEVDYHSSVITALDHHQHMLYFVTIPKLNFISVEIKLAVTGISVPRLVQANTKDIFKGLRHRPICKGNSVGYQHTGDPLHSRALAHSRAPLFTQPCPHCSHSRAPGEQWARLCVFTLQGCVQAARLCRGSPVQQKVHKKCSGSVKTSHHQTSQILKAL